MAKNTIKLSYLSISTDSVMHPPVYSGLDTGLEPDVDEEQYLQHTDAAAAHKKAKHAT